MMFKAGFGWYFGQAMARLLAGLIRLAIVVGLIVGTFYYISQRENHDPLRNLPVKTAPRR